MAGGAEGIRTADLRSAGAAREKTPPLPRLTAERAAGPNARSAPASLALRMGQGAAGAMDAGPCPEGGPALDTSNMPAHVLKELRA